MERKVKQIIIKAKEMMQNNFYHNFAHAVDFDSSICRLAEMEKIGSYNKFLLRTLAYVHDIIYIPNRNDNEEKSAKFAVEYLPKIGYSNYETGIIAGLTLTTKMPTNPKNLLEKIACDADLDNLGREDFLKKGELVRKDFNIPKNKWTKLQLDFLKKHKYYTKSARKLRNAGLQKNIKKLRKLIGEEKC